jgi:hypothetical protein
VIEEITMRNNLGQLMSQFVAERVDSPHPEEIEIWSQLIYAALFSVGFVVWIPTTKELTSKDEMTSELNRLIGNIAKDADLWIGRKLRDVLQITDSNITVSSASEIKFHLGAMFTEAVDAMAERKFKAEEARSHACFEHLLENLKKLALTAKAPIDVQHILQQGIAGTDAMANEVRKALNRKKY